MTGSYSTLSIAVSVEMSMPWKIGGLALESVDPRSMRVRDRPEFYVFGEQLDMTGPIGGFHF